MHPLHDYQVPCFLWIHTNTFVLSVSIPLLKCAGKKTLGPSSHAFLELGQMDNYYLVEINS